MLYKYLNIYFWHQTYFWTEVYTRRMYHVFATFSICYKHGPPWKFKTLILGCLDEFIADVLTDIALDHIIHIYVIMIMIHVMRFVPTWSITQETGFSHDAAHINQRFFTICATFLYIGKGFTINTTLVILWALCKHKNGVMGYLFRCIET